MKVRLAEKKVDHLVALMAALLAGLKAGHLAAQSVVPLDDSQVEL